MTDTEPSARRSQGVGRSPRREEAAHNGGLRWPRRNGQRMSSVSSRDDSPRPLSGSLVTTGPVAELSRDPRLSPLLASVRTGRLASGPSFEVGVRELRAGRCVSPLTEARYNAARGALLWPRKAERRRRAGGGRSRTCAGMGAWAYAHSGISPEGLEGLEPTASGPRSATSARRESPGQRLANVKQEVGGDPLFIDPPRPPCLLSG